MKKRFYCLFAIPLTGCGHQEATVANHSDVQMPKAAADAMEAKNPAPAGFKLSAGVLDNIALGNWAKEKRDFKGGDAFTKDFDDSVADGRDFAVMIPMARGTNSSVANWSYDKDKAILTLRLTMDYGANLEGQMATFQRSDHYGDPKSMSNAFGATLDVTPVTNWLIGVGTSDGYTGIIPKDNLGLSESHVSYSDLQVKIPMPGDEARKTVAGMTLRIEGHVAKDNSGHTVECDLQVEQPKIDYAYETTLNTCIVQARFSRIAFLASNGRVVKQWTK
jgi:hypothetical protein